MLKFFAKDTSTNIRTHEMNWVLLTPHGITMGIKNTTKEKLND